MEIRKILKDEMKEVLAHEIFKHLGFFDTDIEQCINGLRFYPMKKNF